MSSTYTVSILVPIYGVEQYIERCSRSLFEQTYPDLEFVFVDDCSPDGSVDVLRRVIKDYPMREERVSIIRHQHNKGLAAARNTALDHATGEFICVVDSDDWMELDAVERLVNKQLETSADIVAGNMVMHMKEGDVPFYERKYSSKEELVLQQMQKTWDHTIWRRIIRRSLFEDHHIRCIEGCDMTEDRYQMVQLAYYADSYAQIDDIVYHYERRNEGSIMAQKAKNKILRRNYQYFRNWLGIRNFFADKEPVFYKEATERAMEFARVFLTSTVKHDSKDWYGRLASILDKEEESNQELVGWPIKGFKGLFCRSFYWAEVNFKINRVFRFIKRKVAWLR